MKKIAILFAMLAGLAATTASAQNTASSYSVTADFSYTSNYVFRGVEQADDAFTPSVEIAADNFYLGLWTMQPVTKHQNNEIDIYAGYTQKINDRFSLEAVATYYWYPEASTYQTSKSYEIGLGGTYTYRRITANVYAYYDFRLESTTVVGSVGYSFPIEKLGTSIDVAFFAGNVSGRDVLPDALRTGVKESYIYYGGDISIPYHLTDKATITAGLHYATNDNAGLHSTTDGSFIGNAPDNKLWFTIGLSVGF